MRFTLWNAPRLTHKTCLPLSSLVSGTICVEACTTHLIRLSPLLRLPTSPKGVTMGMARRFESFGPLVQLRLSPLSLLQSVPQSGAVLDSNIYADRRGPPSENLDFDIEA